MCTVKATSGTCIMYTVHVPSINNYVNADSISPFNVLSSVTGTYTLLAKLMAALYKVRRKYLPTRILIETTYGKQW